MILHTRIRYLALFGLLLSGLFFISACWGDDDDEVVEENPDDAGLNLDEVSRIDHLIELISGPEQDDLRGHSFEIDAWILVPPQSRSAPGTPPQGCPVVPEKQEWLADEPLTTRINVAGATIPNERLTQTAPVLRLVVPYQLGFIDIPERARIRGQVLDEQYAGCPLAETLFILEEVVEELPRDDEHEIADLVSDWDEVTSDLGQLTLEFPSGWDVEERNSGPSSRIRFLGPEPFRTIRLEIQEGETWWHPDSHGGNPPDVLGGDHREPANAGQAYARLVDDRRRSAADERELRLVFNHQGNTVVLAMMLRDGDDPDLESAWVFSEMASRLHLHGDIGMSDPMDPILAASDELGDGPFLSEDDARYTAIQASGLTAAEAIEAELVTERAARAAVDGACRNFDGRPSGVWLVTVGGVTPSGSDAHRLVYLDAGSGVRLCQTEAPNAD
jgi:hypothetical protein